MRKQKPAKPIDRLMAAMDACAVARSDAAWTQGYRARFETGPHNSREANRLYEKEQVQWANVQRVEARFRRLALRLLSVGADR